MQHAHVDGGGEVTLRASAGRRMDGVLGVSITLQGAVDSGDSNHVTQVRRFAMECADRLRRSAPGCERCYALHLSPVVGARGGPCIDGEYTVTVEDHERGARFDDVLFLNIHEGRPPHAGAVEGCDVPYRCLLPQGVDNLLVVGRGAAYIRRGHDPTGMRARPLVMGQAAGVAADARDRVGHHGQGGGSPRTAAPPGRRRVPPRRCRSPARAGARLSRREFPFVSAGTAAAHVIECFATPGATAR